MNGIVHLVYRLRLVTWLVVAAGAAVLWITTPEVQFKQSVEDFFPRDDPALIAYKKSVSTFGEDQFVIAAYDDPELWSPEGMNRIGSLVKELKRELTGAKRIDSIDDMPVPWKVDAAVEASIKNPFALLGGLATVKTEVNRLAKQPKKLAELRQRIVEHPLFNNLLIDPSGKMVAVVIHLKSEQAERRETIQSIRRVANSFGRKNDIERVAVVGPPVLVVDGFTSLEKDNRTLAVAAMILMAATMFVAIRSPFWALLPLIAGWVTWLITAACINWFDLRLTLSSGPIVAQTVVLCMPAASHLAIRYGQSIREIPDLNEAARRSLLLTLPPVAWCSITAACGYLATWMSSTVLPVSQMGLTMFVTNLMAGLLTYTLAAGVMDVHNRFRRPGTAKRDSIIGTNVGRTTSWVISHPAATLLIFALPCILLAIGMSRLELQSNYIRVFRQDSRVAQDYRFAEERMGGIGLVEIIFPAPEKVDAEWIARLRKINEEIIAVDPQLIKGVISVAELLGTSNTLSSSNSEEIEQKIADQVLTKKLQLLSLPGQSHFLDSVWNRKKNTMRLLVRIRESSDAERKEAGFSKMLSVARSRLSEEAYLTGLSHLMTQITEAVIFTASRSVIWACLMILLMLFVALRSGLLAVLSLAPTLLGVGLVLGVMGWLDLRIDMATALVASVAIGLSVDDAFHCLLRWKQEIKQGRSRGQALRLAYAGAGPGVILSSSAVSIGFLALLFSEFLPTANFGWLVAVATLGGSIGNLVFVPACIALLERFEAREGTPDHGAPIEE